jgi:uncharacterized protein YbbK (DUF523 family)
MRILISACLLGVCCRYDGASKSYPGIAELAKEHTLVPVCPEQLGGLPTPRPPSERQGDRVVSVNGTDVTEQYRRGAEETLKLFELLACDAAVLKEKSPSCGKDVIYDGSFSETLTEGDGVAAELLRNHGIAVYGESQIKELLK